MKYSLCLLYGLISLTFAYIQSEERVSNFYYPHRVKGTPYNQVNPNFTYPESILVNSSQANIPYQGQVYSGYLTVNPTTLSNIFYVLYPAGGANNHDATINNTAPLILWLQGGPGCADGIGNYAEIGPFEIVNQNGTLMPVLRDISWNDAYNLLFVDSPAGVGYSVSGNETYATAYEVAQFLQVFLLRFFEVYTSLSKNDFYIFGESYGGHYVPALGSIIVQNVSQNEINIKGIGVGNGCTDVYHQGASTSDLSFALGLLDQKYRDQVANIEINVQELISNGNLTGAQILLDQMGDLIAKIDFNINQYNFEQYPPDIPNPPYPDWLNLQSTKIAYGVDPTVTYQDCVDCENDFLADMVTSYAGNYTYLLTQSTIPDFKILIYGGQNDMICNNLGAQLFLQRLSWTKITNFVNSQKQILKDNSGKVIGNYKHYDRLTFAIVYAAGHMSPTDQPASVRLILEHYMNNSF